MRGAGGVEDDTVPFDFTFAGIPADCASLRQSKRWQKQGLWFCAGLLTFNL